MSYSDIHTMLLFCKNNSFKELAVSVPQICAIFHRLREVNSSILYNIDDFSMNIHQIKKLRISFSKKSLQNRKRITTLHFKRILTLRFIWCWIIKKIKRSWYYFKKQLLTFKFLCRMNLQKKNSFIWIETNF